MVPGEGKRNYYPDFPWSAGTARGHRDVALFPGIDEAPISLEFVSVNGGNVMG